MKFRLVFYSNNPLVYKFLTPDLLRVVWESPPAPPFESLIGTEAEKHNIAFSKYDGDFDYECDSLEELMITFPEYFL